MTSIRYISTRANAYGRHNSKPATKHISEGAGTTLCGRKLSDPYYVSSMSEHALCSRCDAQRDTADRVSGAS